MADAASSGFPYFELLSHNKHSKSGKTIMSSSSSSSEDENMLAVVAAVQEYYYTHMCKKPYRPPTVSGATYVNKILHGPGDRCRELFRMDRHVFYKLHVGIDAGSILRDSIAEQMWSDLLGE
ncbi:hypothetical protein QJS10_CPB14g01595 [Acorus calamus]|uniref:DUF8040 domain-containing protein n=1 Tax=Acorus calamus TaxID=4465 RepID=A0AAV9DB14_ACOCL|nr:hypothetical protein QJS10_CPB14g01595 [Acorus calamus]